MKEQEYLKEKRNIGFFVINITLFLSLYGILVDYLQDLTKIKDHLLVTTPIILVAASLLVIRLVVTKTPVSAIGITTKNLIPALIEAFILSLVVLALIIGVKALFIHTIPSLHDTPLFRMTKQQGLRKVIFTCIYALHAFLQELVARGAIQGMFYELFPFKHRTFYSILLASIVFASIHSMYELKAVIAVFFFGLFWGWLYARQKTIFGCALSHIIIGLVFFGFINAPL